MTTIDYQQAAIEAMTVDFRPSPYLNSDQNDEQRSAYWVAMRDKLTAAEPHLRAAWEQELARAVKRLPWNGVTHGGTMVPLDSVLDLLEGGDVQ